MFDVKTVTEGASAEVDVLHPVTRAKVGATVTLAGPEHEARKAFGFERARRARARVMKGGRFTPTDPEDDAADDLEELVAYTLGWKGFSEDGKEIAFSKEAARALFGRPDMAWLRVQLLEVADRREVFIRSSASG